jgi:transcription antitermination factor NusG
MPWYVLHTKSRNEKKIAALLSSRNVKVYCPVREEVRQWSDRRKKVSEPVFKSFVFVFLEDYKMDATPVLEIPGAVRFLWWQGKPGVVREEEIEAIRNFLTMYKDTAITVEVKAGQSVTIKEGPLREQRGTVLQVKGDKVYLRLESLGLEMIAKVQVQAITANKDS